MPSRLFASLLTATLGLVGTSLATGCDSADVGLERYTGVIEVSLSPDVSGTALRLVAVDDQGCDHPLRVGLVVSDRERLHVRVEGIDRPRGVSCDAIIPASAAVPLPFRTQGVFPVIVEHAGSRDEYTYSIGFAGERLDAVRTTTTRPGSP